MLLNEFDYDLGSCCICEKTGKDVRNIIMLDFEAPVPGTGWGCVVCDLPNNGAIAIICDNCKDGMEDVESKLKYICSNYIGKSKKRIPIADFKKITFKHLDRFHRDRWAKSN